MNLAEHKLVYYRKAESYRLRLLELVSEAEAEGIALEGGYCASGNRARTNLINFDQVSDSDKERV